MPITYTNSINTGWRETEAVVAQKVNVLLVDDIDGSEAQGTIQFGIDGASYEIDLNHQHARELRAILAGYIEKGRKVPSPTGRSGRPRRTAVNGSNNKEIREWAKARGHKVNDRGRIPADVIAEYEEEHGE
jgi:Lsr2